MEIAARCQVSPTYGRSFKDELFRQEVVQDLVVCVTDHDGTMPFTVKDSLLRALAESVYDHPGNAEVAANCGVLKMVGEALEKIDSYACLTENLLCVTNNVIGMSQATHSLLRESRIVPSLVRLAISSNGEHDVATAAIANLSNNPDMREELIEAGATICIQSPFPPSDLPFLLSGPFPRTYTNAFACFQEQSMPWQRSCRFTPRN